MTEGKFKVRDIKGLTPGIDPTQSEEMFALSGRNYAFDSLGVKSAFGNRYLSPIPLSIPDFVQGVKFGLRGGDRVFVMTVHGIVEWIESVGSWRYIYMTEDTSSSPYRWTFEYLNGYVYFAHPLVGCLVYNTDTEICDRHENVANAIVENILSVTQNNGRLIFITPIMFFYSAPSNGLDCIVTLGGAGFQIIAERVPGDPIIANSYGRGVLTWCTGGVMRSEFTGDAAVYRHRSLNIDLRPINSFCMARVDEDTLIVLDERGLFQSRGESFTPYAPLFNEFLINFLQENKYRSGNNLRLEWDIRQSRLFLSYSDSYADPLFERCFVYYPPLDKWGEFNEPHYGILPIRIEDSERADDYHGFVDSTGRIRYWRPIGSREDEAATSPTPRVSNLYTPVVQKPAQFLVDESGLLLSTSARVNTISKAGLSETEGYYAPEATSPQQADRIGLDALVRFGFIRLTGPTVADEASEITAAVIRNVKSGLTDLVTEDYNVVPDDVDDEDYNESVGGDEDLGLQDANYINHSFELVGTLDGDTDFDRVVPDMVDFQKAARFFTCNSVGIWHVVEIGASDVGDAFHVRTFEVNGTSAGRYL